METIMFYLLFYWFAELETRRAINVRMIIAAVLLLVYLVTTILVFVMESIKDDGIPVLGVIPMCLFILFSIRIAKDDIAYRSPVMIKSEAEIKRAAEQRFTEKTYDECIKRCGVKFFIKYYKQIKSLQLRDVSVTENYSPAEIQDRLAAAQKLIYYNMDEFTFKKIISTYDGIIESTYIDQAKELLSECQKNSKCVKSKTGERDVDNS